MISKTHRSYSGVKKIVIKPISLQSKSNNEVSQEDVSKLMNFISSVYSKQDEGNFSKEELYQLVEEICIKKQEENLFNKLKEELNKYIQDKVKKLIEESNSENFFEIVNEIWSDHIEQLNKIRNVFLYLDRTCVSYAKDRSSNHSIIWELGNFIFGDYLGKNVDLIKIIVEKLLNKIELVRMGQLLTVDSISRVTNMLQVLNFYSTFFEPLLLASSSEFFAKEGCLLLGISSSGVKTTPSIDACSFLAHIDRRLLELEGPLGQYLHPSSRRPLSNVILEHLLKPHVEYLLTNGFNVMMNEKKIDDLGKMYLLYDKVNHLSLLKTYWANYISNEGEKIISKFQLLPSSDQKNSQSFIMEEIIELHDYLEKILLTSFYSDEKFKTALKSSFEKFLNFDSKVSAEHLVKLIDKHLKISNKVIENNLITDDNTSAYEKFIKDNRLLCILNENNLKSIELFLNKIIIIFRYLTEKDFFEFFYKKYLSYRLLNNKTANIFNVEKLILNKLRVECGSNYTAKLDGMFTDIELSKLCQSNFQQYLGEIVASLNNDPQLIEKDTKIIQINENDQIVLNSQIISNSMSIKVLTTGFWPTTTSSNVYLPPELTYMKEKFEEFYSKNFQGRKLQWIPSLDRCLVVAHFPTGRKDLDVTLHQAVVLRSFNTNNILTFKEIQQITSIDTDELKFLLISLSYGKEGTRVLLHNNTSPSSSTSAPSELFNSINPTDSFVFNTKFSNEYYHIKIPMLNINSNTEEIQKNNEEIFKEREYQVDASIVSIMKSKKVLTHNILIQEVTSRLKFNCSANDIKKRIESLIEREYLQRDSIDNNLYHYLA